jgi:WD40 repeat protein
MRPFWLGIAVAVLLAPSLSADETEGSRRGMRDPGLIIDLKGPSGEVDVLRFTPDGKTLLSAGDDKGVHTWAVEPRRLRPGPTLRWSRWRNQRGAIYTMALSPDRDARLVAVAGCGVYNTNSAVAVFERRTGRVVHALRELPSSTDTLWALDFSPAGDRLVIGGERGGVWVWRLGEPKAQRIGRHEGKEREPWVRLVAFLDADRLLSVPQKGDALLWDLRRPGARPTPRNLFTHSPRERVAISADRKWVAAAVTTVGEKPFNGVEVRSVESGKGRSFRFEPDERPNSLALDADGRRLAVGLRLTPLRTAFPHDRGGRVDLFDLDDPGGLPRRGPRPLFYPQVLAFHPDGRHLAMIDAEDFRVGLYELERPGVPVAVATSEGDCLYGVGLSAGPERLLGVRTLRNPSPAHPNDRGRGLWRVFDLDRRAWVDAAGFKPVEPIRTQGGWEVEPDPDDPTQWFVKKGESGPRHRLPLDLSFDHWPRCYTFLPRREGRPERLAVGHYWGVSLFELGSEKPRRVRHFAGHGGYVTSVAPSSDGTVLLSASRDMTVCAWSLADWPSHPHLGARFAERLGGLWVDQVDPGSPAWEAGLVKGDEIRAFVYNQKDLLYDPHGDYPAALRRERGIPARSMTTDVKVVLQRLKDLEPNHELVFLVRRETQKGLAWHLSRVQQRPIWCFFPSRRGDWVLWRWHDFFYDASPGGDDLAGWVLCGHVEQTPRFFRARDFEGRGTFYNPAKVTEAIAERTFTPDPRRIVDVEPPRLTLKADPEEVADGPVTLTLTVTPLGSRDVHRPRHLVLWVGDCQYREWPSEAQKGAWPPAGPFTDRVVIPAKDLRHGLNRLTLQCFNGAGTSTSKSVTVLRKGERPRPRLFVQLVGISDYRKARAPAGFKRFNPLEGISTDLVDQRRLWRRAAGSLFASVEVDALENDDATPDAILASLKALAARAGPDDLLVLYLAGHGELERGAEGTFTFVGPRFDPTRPRTTGLTTDALYRQLTSLRCRKLVLLMTCRSGDALQRTVRGDPVRELTPGGVGPAVLTACKPHESAIVPDDGSLFCHALVEAGRRQERLDVRGLVDFVRARVPQLLQELQEEARREKNPARDWLLKATQTPDFFSGDPDVERLPVLEKKSD